MEWASRESLSGPSPFTSGSPVVLPFDPVLCPVSNRTDRHTVSGAGMVAIQNGSFASLRTTDDGRARRIAVH